MSDTSFGPIFIMAGSLLNRYAHECRNTMNIVLFIRQIKTSLAYLLPSSPFCMAKLRLRRDRAYLQIQPTVKAIMMDVFDATPARLAFFSPRRFPILFTRKLRQACHTLEEKGQPNRCCHTQSEWSLDAETRSIDWAASAVGPSLKNAIVSIGEG